MLNIQKYVVKQRAKRRYNTNIRPIAMRKRDLVLQKVTNLTKKGKLQPNWESIFRVRHELSHVAYK